MARDIPADRHGFQVRQIDCFIVGAKTSVSGNISGMKPLVFHGEAVRRIAPRKIHLLRRIIPITGKIDMTTGRASLTHNGPHIFEAKLAAIAECPGGLRKTGEVGLRVEFTAWNFPLQLRHGKGSLAQREPAGETRAERQVAQSCNFKLLPVELAKVNG